jgi:hypothetical protein
MLTRVQKGFYFVPSLPFFAIGFAVLTAPYLHRRIMRIQAGKNLHKTLTIACFLLLVSAFVFSFMQVGKTRRNAEMLHDVYAIGKVVPAHTTVSVPGFDTWNQWDLQSYFMRYFNISLDDQSRNRFLLVDRKLQPDTVAGYVPVPVETYRYTLYEKK